MKEQKLITHHSRDGFDREVNELLAEGWRVIPGTLVCAITECSYSRLETQPGQTQTTMSERWAIVLEK
jgi:hypothetical protein